MLLAFQESMRAVFSGRYRKPWLRYLMPVLVTLAMAYAVLAATLYPPAKAPAYMPVIISAEIAFQYVRAALVGWFLVAVKVSDVRWQREPFGIIYGFSVSTAGILLATLVRSQFGTAFPWVITYGPSVAYLFSALIWLNAFWPRPLRLEILPPSTTEEMVVEINGYSNALKNTFRRGKPV